MNKPARYVIFLGLATGIFFAGLLGYRYVETKSAACECAEPVDAQYFASLNPLRDRAPERSAIETIQTMQNGHCDELPQHQRCAEEMRYDITKWKLTGREEKGNSATFRFTVWRVSHGMSPASSFSDPVWVSVERKDKDWKLGAIDLYY